MVGNYYPPIDDGGPLTYPAPRFYLAWILYEFQVEMNMNMEKTMMNENMEKTMLITVNDYQRITGLIEFSALKNKSPEIAGRLLQELKSAKTVPQDRISRNIVTMNSRALLREITSGREVEITITYPQDADSKEQKVSVLSPIGVALLGCREGDITSWRVPGGIGRFKVEKILYQPEAEGHFYL